MGGLISALLPYGGFAVVIVVVVVMGAYGLFQVAMKLLEHHRASQKASIEKLNFTEHFFEKIAGKKVQPLVRERAIEILTGRTNIRVHELEYLLHLEGIDHKIKEYSRTKPDLWIDETKPLKEQLQFREGLSTVKDQKKAVRRNHLEYAFSAFFGGYTPYFLWLNDWYFNWLFTICMVLLFTSLIIFAFSRLIRASRIESAQRLHKSISEYWAGREE